MGEKDKKVTQLQSAIGGLESLLSRLQQGAADAGARTEAIIEARKRDVLAAVGEGDAEAKRRLHKLDGELQEIQRTQADYDFALVEGRKKLAAARVGLAAAERAVLGQKIEGAITERLRLGAELETEILRNVIPQLQEIRAATEKLAVCGRDLGLTANFRQQSLGRALGFVVSMVYREFPLQKTILSGGELAWGLEPAVLNKAKPLTTVDAEYFSRTREQVRAVLAKDPAEVAAE